MTGPLHAMSYHILHQDICADDSARLWRRVRHTAGELLDERLNTLSSGLYALARFRKVSLEDRNPSKPCTKIAHQIPHVY